MRREDDDEHVAALRDLLRAADREIETPPGLAAALRTSVGAAVGSGRRAGPLPPSRWRPRYVLPVVAAVCLVTAVALGSWWLLRPPTTNGSSVSAERVTLTVHNVESACRPLRTLECSLRLAKDPYARYASPGNAAGRVWHGDRLPVRCVVTDGTLVRDESGLTSTRWYLVTTRTGVPGWLPGVRTRDRTEVPACSDAETRPLR